MKKLLYLIAFLVPLFGIVPNMTPLQIKESHVGYLVSKVIDGDTIEIETGNQKQKVRFIGIDTPETVDPRKTVQCFGKEASDKTKELLFGKSVSLSTDPVSGNKDKYGRLLRYVYLPDGTFVNKLLISEGFAHEYTYMSIPYKFQKEFKEAQKLARENKKGLWGDNICKP